MTPVGGGALSANVLAMRKAILEQNDALRVATRPTVGVPDTVATPSTSFTGAMQSALADVNALQAQSGAASEAWERGTTTDIASVMLARQKASVGFEATLQVRNKLLSAYSDIMNLPL